MANIVLTTLNAKYIHTAFGLRYLLANLGPLRSQASILEFDINQRATDIVEILLAQKPSIIGIGVYIWNATLSTEVVAALKRVQPNITVILGGPEVSYEAGLQPIVELADYVITGEADLKFAEVCHQLLQGSKPGTKIIPADLPDLARLALPYELYEDRDVAHRIIYVEASRGCPFTCEFCLSSLDIPVRQFALPAFLAGLQTLLDRGVKQFKFVDRTFNLNLNASKAILEFFHERYRPGLFLHFEMIPDRLPEALREPIAKFPPGALQFEVGIQTFNEDVSNRIKRRQNYGKIADNFRFLREQTGVYIHADLIVGLPGENLESFGLGFDRLVAMGPQEIQVGILKRLRGTPIVRHDVEWQMVYNAHPPYEMLQNKLIDFAGMQRMRRFARYWDMVANSGNFVETTPLLWTPNEPRTIDPPSRQAVAASAEVSSPFTAFLRFSDWLFVQAGRQHSIALVHLAKLLFEYLTEQLRHDPRHTAVILWRDYQRGGRSDRPGFLQAWLPEESTATKRTLHSISPKRQARHFAQILER
jgi:radical SAM superfamily enzyme YgiQ (UPF0313 family)